MLFASAANRMLARQGGRPSLTHPGAMAPFFRCAPVIRASLLMRPPRWLASRWV